MKFTIPVTWFLLSIDNSVIRYRMKPIRRLKCSKTRLKKIFLLLLLVTVMQMLSYFLRDFMISVSLSLAIKGNYDISLGTHSTANLPSVFLL